MFAIGLPDKTKFDPIHVSGETRLAIQHHISKVDHYDYRLQEGDITHSFAARSLPGEKDKILLVRQPTHLASYSDFEGTIPSGYGAGTVKKVYDNTIEVIKSDENRIKLILPEGEHTLVPLKNKDYLLIKNKNTIPDPITTKIEMKDASNKELDFNDNNKIFQPKVDGGHTLFRLRSDGINRVYSYRTSKKTGKPIEHSHQVPLLRDANVPSDLNGIELRGELYGKTRDGKPMSVEDVAGILNSGIQESRRKQGIKGRLEPYMFRIVKWKNGENVEDAPYSRHIEMMKVIADKVPGFRMPEIADTPDKKRELYNQIKAKKHPDTIEGIVEYDLNAPGGDPKKVKLRDTHEVVIREIFPAQTKSGKQMAGGFTYSWKPDSAVVGRVGTGFSEAMRKDMLSNPEKYIGGTARIKTQQVFRSGAARAPSFYSMHVEKNLMEKNAIIKEAFNDELNKIANEMEKEAFIPGLSAIVGHGAANTALLGILKNKKLAQDLGESLAESAYRPTKASKALSLSGGLVPELEMGYTHATKALNDFTTNPKYKTIRRYASVLGDKSNAQLKSGVMTEKGRGHIKNIVDRLSSEYGKGGKIDHPLFNHLKDTNNNEDVIDGLLKIREKSPIIKDVIPSALKKYHEITKGKPLPVRSNKDLPILSGASIAATMAIDPALGIWNAFKRFTGGHAFNDVKPIAKLRKKSTELLVTNRAKDLYQQGIDGKDIKFRAIKRKFDEIALNPVTSEAKNTAYDIGALTRKSIDAGY